MKKIILLLLICSSLVSANSGYYPVSIFNPNGLKSFSYCEFDKPCRYLNNQNLTEMQKDINIKNNNVSRALVYSFLSVLGVIITITLIVVCVVKIVVKRL